mgnify:CR=1 FL=1
MSTTTIRISEETHRALHALARESGMSIAGLIAQAVETLRRQRLLEQSNAAYASLRDDTAAWEAEQQERRVWEATLRDGMEGQ